MNTVGEEILYCNNTRNVNFMGNTVINGVCAPNSILCTNGITAGDNVLTTSSKPTGGNVNIAIENTGANGFASCYWNAPNESVQIFVGQLGGLNLRTNTAHPIQFTTYTDEEGAPTRTF